MNKVSELPIIEFKDRLEWREWLKKNHRQQEGIFLKLFKKGFAKNSFTHAEALDEALCFGWIDTLGRTLDKESWVLKFTHRRPKSMWSKRNQENVERLIKEKRMTKFGLEEIEKAKKDGRWEAAYDSPKNMVVPKDFLELLSTDKKAEKFFKSLNKTNTYSIAWRLQTAKNPDTRKKRLESILIMMRKGIKFH